MPDDGTTSAPSRDSLEDSALGQIAAEVARRAAASVRGKLGTAHQVRTKATPTDAVTSADLETEDLIRAELRLATPTASLRGEEGLTVEGTSDIEWVIDPIDGTINFLYNLPVVAVSIAAVRRDRVVAAAVADVIRSEIFTAYRGNGAYLDGRPVHVSTASDLSNSLIATGFSYSAERRRQEAEVVKRLLPAARDIRCFGSAALHLAWVACGRVDAYWQSETKPWDVAAGALLAEEGGAVVELESAGDGWVLAAPPPLFGPLRELVSA